MKRSALAGKRHILTLASATATALALLASPTSFTGQSQLMAFSGSDSEPAHESVQFDSFMDYCTEDNNSDMALYTLDLIGVMAGSTRCHEMEAYLAEQDEVTIAGGPLSELTAFRFFDKLKKLTVVTEVPARVQQLKGIKNLATLSITGPTKAVGEVSPALEQLTLIGAAKVDLSELKLNPKLKYLTIQKSPGIDVEDLAELKELRELEISASELSELDDLAAVPAVAWVSRLVLNDNGISSIAALKGLSRLQHLVAERNSISDLAPLTRARRLFALNLTANKVSSLAALKDNVILEYLELDENPLGTTVSKTADNCPTSAKSKAVAAWCAR